MRTIIMLINQREEGLAISDPDTKMLWGRAAGICSNPACKADLTGLVEQGNYNVGEMAHIIAKSAKGPRGAGAGGSDSYENLILLCPTCHRHIDKSPDGTYTVEQLNSWKKQHEETIRARASELRFSDRRELVEAVSRLLIENRSIWMEHGPESIPAQNDFGSNAHRIWNLRKLDTVIPNNNKIINMIENNASLLGASDYQEFINFKNHAKSFEQNQYSRLDQYVTFPQSFAKAFGL